MEHAADVLAGVPVRGLKREEYQTLVDLGAFEGERVEMLYGRIVEMPPQGPLHDGTVDLVNGVLTRALAGRALVRVQSSFVAADSVPVPDLAVVPPGDYRRQHPQRAFLIVEVAESSLVKDRGAKARLYAASGVPEYWVVNLADELLEVHTEPASERYLRVQPYRAGERVTLVGFPDLEVEVSAFLR